MKALRTLTDPSGLFACAARKGLFLARTGCVELLVSSRFPVQGLTESLTSDSCQNSKWGKAHHQDCEPPPASDVSGSRGHDCGLVAGAAGGWQPDWPPPASHHACLSKAVQSPDAAVRRRGVVFSKLFAR